MIMEVEESGVTASDGQFYHYGHNSNRIKLFDAVHLHTFLPLSHRLPLRTEHPLRNHAMSVRINTFTLSVYKKHYAHIPSAEST